MQFKTAALLASILPAAALSACADPQIQYRLPQLNEAQRQHLVCPAPVEAAQIVEGLPSWVWLTTSAGEVVQGPDGTMWITFESANAREGELLTRLNTATGGHFECHDDVEWFADLWANPDLTGGDE